MKYITLVAFLFLITGDFTYGAVTGSKCSNPENENLPYDGEYAFNAIMKCIFVVDDEDVLHCNKNWTLLDKCMHDISNNLRACTDSSSGIPDLSEDIFESIGIRICKNNETLVKDMVDFNNDRECMNAISKPLESCHSRKSIFDVIRNINVSSKDFCKKAKDLTECIEKTVKAHCSAKRGEFIPYAMRALLGPCPLILE